MAGRPTGKSYFLNRMSGAAPLDEEIQGDDDIEEGDFSELLDHWKEAISKGEEDPYAFEEDLFADDADDIELDDE